MAFFGPLTYFLYQNPGIIRYPLFKLAYYLNLLAMFNGWYMSWLWTQGIPADDERTFRRVAVFNAWVVICLFVMELPLILSTI